jgi:hypothetical protein
MRPGLAPSIGKDGQPKRSTANGLGSANGVSPVIISAGGRPVAGKRLPVDQDHVPRPLLQMQGRAAPTVPAPKTTTSALSSAIRRSHAGCERLSLPQ